MSDVRRGMRIKCAAILYNGVIYEGESHSEIGLELVRKGITKPPYPGGEAQGFVTECGRFVNRYQALRIAASAKQVTWGTTMHHEELFSEDLRVCRWYPGIHKKSEDRPVFSPLFRL